MREYWFRQSRQVVKRKPRPHDCRLPRPDWIECAGSIRECKVCGTWWLSFLNDERYDGVWQWKQVERSDDPDFRPACLDEFDPRYDPR